MDYQSIQPYTMALNKVTLAAGTTSTLNNTGTTTYCIRGKAYTKAAMANAATPVLDASTGRAFIPVPANFGSVFLIGFTAAAALACVQGQVVPLNSSGLFINAPNFGGVPLDFCPVAYMIVKAGATASSAPGWVFGTDSNSVSTGVVYTFVDLIGMPDRPQIA